MIPDEAVEAAARVHQDLVARGGYPKWDELLPSGHPWRLDYMRAALEAAAPHLMEQAWDECEAAPYEIRLEPGGKFWQPYKDNPYRKPTGAV